MAIAGFRKSKYLADQQIDWLGGSAFAAAPTSITLHAYTTPPSDDSGTGAVEANYTGYASVSFQGLLGTKTGTNRTIVRNDANGDSNDDITFTEIPLGEGPVRIRAWSIKHNNGQILYWASDDVTVRGGQSPKISSGYLVVSEE